MKNSSLKLSILLVLIATVFWFSGSWWYYSCKIKNVCKSQTVTQQPTKKIQNNIPQVSILTDTHAPIQIIDTDNDGHIDTINSLAEIQKNGIKIYPNPFSNQINIIAKTNEPFQINVYNVQGQVMCKQSTRTIHTDTWSRGIYFVQIELNGKQFVQKIIK